MAPHIYLVNPHADYTHWYDVDVFADMGYPAASCMADLSTLTVAAMIPDDFVVELTDEKVSPANLDTEADFVGITGKVTQWGRMRTLAREFRKRGKVVIVGGPYASLSPSVVREHCDILVRGELEDISEQLFADLREGHWKDEYVGGRPDLSRSPIPRWSLYDNQRAVHGSVQTTRGCPFECEFCDVIQYVGRKQRFKPPQQVLAELDVLYAHGYRAVFLCDDNFTVYRNRTKELLVELREWNRRRTEGRVGFGTQVSIDAARDDELLQLCAESGLLVCYVGIETPNEESLKETKKRQNTKIDLLEEVQRFVDHGIMVSAGMIVGFDHDGPDIFRRQYEFAMSSPIANITVAVLVAPEATPLHARMEKAGRLRVGPEAATSPVDTNIVPMGMTRSQLMNGVRWLAKELYRPAAFGERLVRFIERAGKRDDPLKGQSRRYSRTIERDYYNLLTSIPSLGPEEAEMWSRVSKAVARNRSVDPYAIWYSLAFFLQARYLIRQLDASFPLTDEMLAEAERADGTGVPRSAVKAPRALSASREASPR